MEIDRFVMIIIMTITSMMRIIICGVMRMRFMVVEIKRWKEREREGEKETFINGEFVSLYNKPTTQREIVVVIGASYFWGSPFHMIYPFISYISLFIYSN